MIKRLGITLIFVLLQVTVLQATKYVVTNIGKTFSSSNLSINVGDTVIFDLEQMYNVLEVNKTTWDANNNTSNGGFEMPFGGGMIIFKTAGIRYYVCSTQAMQGMKGLITINPAVQASVNYNKSIINDVIQASPNPVKDNVELTFWLKNNSYVTINLLDITGVKVKSMIAGYYSQGQKSEIISLTSLLPGRYILVFQSTDEKRIIPLVVVR